MTDSSDSKCGGKPQYYQWHAAAVGGVSLIAIALAAVLYLGLGMPWQQAAGLPLLVVGLALVAWNTHWALCFAAFTITPFGVVQHELLGVTLNLPEVLILALAAKEGARFLYQRRGLPAAFPTRALLAFVVAAMVAVATGLAHANGAVRVLQDFRQFVEFLVLFWLVLQCVSGRDEAIRIAFCYVLGASLIAVHGIVQQIVPFGITETQISSDFVLHQGIRSGSFYGATPLGGLMVLAIAPALGVILSSKRRAIQVLMVLCVLLCLVAIVFTRTRGSWIGLAVALALIVVSIRPSGKMLAAAAGAGMVLAFVLGPVVFQRLYTLADPVQDLSLMARAQYYAAAAHIGRAHPVLGLGWGCFYDIDTILNAEKYTPVTMAEIAERDAAEAAERAARLAAKGDRDIDVPVGPVEVEEATVHSAYLQLFAKTGLVGLLAFLALVTVWVERIWRGRDTRFQTDPGHALFVGITAGVAGYLFHSTFENFFQWPVMAQSFWLLFGLSFLLAPRPEGQAPRFGVPLLFMGSASAVFLLFMFACLRLETLHPGHYERNAAKALESGNLEKAIRIAELATEFEKYEPMPHTVHARLLLMQGDTDAAMAALEKAFGTEQRPGGPPIRFTGSRYYFAPARLTLGQYYAGHGDWDSARKQFELARAYTDLTGEAFAEFHALLYEAYASAGDWARALDFGRPSPEALAALDGAQLRDLARAVESRGDWHYLLQVAEVLRSRAGFESEAHFALGRARMGQSDFVGAIEFLERARDAGAPHAAYFLGRALAGAGWGEAALAPFRATPPDDIYYPIALAEAWRIQADTGVDTSEVRQQFIAALAEFDALPSPEAGGVLLLAYRLPDVAALSGARFPAVLLWGDALDQLQNVTGVTVSNDAGGCRIGLNGAALVLELREVENLADWASVERGGARDSVPPGWIDTPQDWFDLAELPTAAVVAEDDGNLALALRGQTWIHGVPDAIDERFGCLAVGRLRDPEGAGRFSMQYLDVASRIAGGATLSAWEPVPEWSARSAYAPPEPAREAVRLIFETNTKAARVAYDDLVLIAIEPPALKP